MSDTGRGPGDLDALATLALANPGDDGHRRALGRALAEAGDPRGALIELQYLKLDRPLDPDEHALERHLLAAHREAWMGPLAEVVAVDEGLRFERGFLSRCHARAAGAVGHPLWATVEHLEGVPYTRPGRAPRPRPAPGEIALHPVMRSLRSLVAGPLMVQALCSGARSRPIESLYYIGPRVRARFSPDTGRREVEFDAAEISALRRCEALPRLSALTLFLASEGGINALVAEDLAPLLSGPVFQRLGSLTLVLPGLARFSAVPDPPPGVPAARVALASPARIRPWLELVHSLSLPLPQLTIKRGDPLPQIFTFRRGPRGRLSQLELVVDAGRAPTPARGEVAEGLRAAVVQSAADSLRALDGAVRSVSIRAARTPADPSLMAPLRAALASLGGLESASS